MLKSTLKTGLLLAMAAIVSGGWLFQAQASKADSQVLALQNQTCSGVVVDEAGVPVIGAAVLIKGTLKGTSTDVNGHFTLPQAKAGDVLEVSYNRIFAPGDVLGITEEDEETGEGLRVSMQLNGEILNQSIEIDFKDLEDDLIEMRLITDDKELIIELL